MRHYSHIGALAIAAALAGPAIGAPVAASSRARMNVRPRPNWKHDPERLAAAEAKRARKAAKRLRDMR